jgi:predicted Zn-dependent protease
MFHGISLNADFNTYYRTFANTMGNFDKLTDPSKINVNPDVIKIVTVPQNMTLADALRTFNVPAADQESMAVLNNMQLTDQLKSGTLIKTLIRGRKPVVR